MGFNMGSMNGSSIMPSVTSISPTLNSSSTVYGSHSTPSTTAYPMYKDSMSVYKDSMTAGYPGMSSSIASLRLKAKQHQVGFSSYSPQPPPLSPRSSCQYTTSTVATKYKESIDFYCIPFLLHCSCFCLNNPLGLCLELKLSEPFKVYLRWSGRITLLRTLYR